MKPSFSKNLDTVEFKTKHGLPKMALHLIAGRITSVMYHGKLQFAHP